MGEISSAADLYRETGFYLIANLFVLPFGLVSLWLLLRFGLARWLSLPPRGLPALARAGALDFAAGLGNGLFLLGFAVLPALALGAYSPARPGWQAFEPGLRLIDNQVRLGSKLLFLLQSLFEEALFRGFALSLLALLLLWICSFFIPRSAGGRVWFFCCLSANLVVSLAFAAVHSRNPEVSPIALANIALAGYWLGALMLWQRSLLGAWSAHFIWNFALAILGLPVSGIHFSAAQYGIGIAGAQPGLLSGGAFGPEAGLPVTLGLLALSIWYTARSWKFSQEALAHDHHSTANALSDRPGGPAEPHTASPDGTRGDQAD
ncbi:CPBP family intramembrane metalloprotease [bacterium]|nr:CPBP family intramembrane metalloprotease [bacterium]